MGKILIGAFAFVGGVATGLLIAKVYARSQVKGAADELLHKIGLGGGTVQGIVDTVFVPAVT